MTRATSVVELSKKLASLNFNESQVQILSDIADSLVKPVQVESCTNDNIFGKTAFHEYFSNVLLVHHATNDDKFKKKAFEFAFKGACVRLGLSARITANPMNQGADVTVELDKFSLKTEAGNKISSSKITISKLMEARWIREISADSSRGTAAAQKVVHHLSQYNRILTLRAFDVYTGMVRTAARYELWEIPKYLLTYISGLSDSDFSTPTINNSFSASVMVLDAATNTTSKAFTFCMDGSVEKVTIRNLSVAHCIHQVTWVVPLDPQQDDQKED